MFGEVTKRVEHLQNMKKFEKYFDLHQRNFEQRRTLPNMKFIIKQGGQTRRAFAEHESGILFVEMLVTFGHGVRWSASVRVETKCDRKLYRTALFLKLVLD